MITLLVVMILGFIVLIAALVTRMPSGSGLQVPEALELPGGVTAVAVTRGQGWVAVVTAPEAGAQAGGQEVLFFDARSGALLQTVPLVVND